MTALIVRIDDPGVFPDGACEALTGDAHATPCKSRAHYMVDGIALCRRHATVVVFEKALEENDARRRTAATRTGQPAKVPLG